MIEAAALPRYHEYMLPTLQAVAELGGSASISEIVEAVIRRQGFTEGQQGVLHNDGPEAHRGSSARPRADGAARPTRPGRPGAGC